MTLRAVWEFLVPIAVAVFSLVVVIRAALHAP
jgi:hypothetical protein